MTTQLSIDFSDVQKARKLGRKAVEGFISENMNVPLDKLARQLSIRKSSVKNIIYGMRKSKVADGIFNVHERENWLV
jgi:transcription initiation factor IIE alpha subunit